MVKGGLRWSLRSQVSLRSFPLRPRRGAQGIEPLRAAARADVTEVFPKAYIMWAGSFACRGCSLRSHIVFRGAPLAARPPCPLPPPALTRRRSSCVPSRGVGFIRSGARARSVSASASLRSAAAKVASLRVPSLFSPKRTSVARFARSLRPQSARQWLTRSLLPKNDRYTMNKLLTSFEEAIFISQHFLFKMQKYFANENVKSKMIKYLPVGRYTKYLTIFNFANFLWLEIQHFEIKKIAL